MLISSCKKHGCKALHYACFFLCARRVIRKSRMLMVFECFEQSINFHCGFSTTTISHMCAKRASSQIKLLARHRNVDRCANAHLCLTKQQWCASNTRRFLSFIRFSWCKLSKIKSIFESVQTIFSLVIVFLKEIAEAFYFIFICIR